MATINIGKLERDMWRAWNRTGAKAAAETVLFYAGQDARLAHELLAQVGANMHDHVRKGIASYLPYP